VPKGTVKTVLRDRGFGFIRSEEGSEIFFHRTSLQGMQFEDVREGLSVEFEVEEAARGPRANNVRPAEKG